MGRLDAIEQAIRNAFAKGNPEDAAFREKVYRSAYAALERSLQANTALTSEAADGRKRNLIAVISAIESEFIPAVEPVRPAQSAPGVTAAPAPSHAGVSPAAADMRRDPAPQPDSRREPEFAPATAGLDWPETPAHRSADRDFDADVAAPGPAQEPPGRALDLEPRPRPWGMIAGLVILVVVLGLAFWTAAEMGLVNMSGSGGGNATQSANTDSDANTGPRRPGDEGELEDWITVFSPSAPTTVTAPAGATAEVVEISGEQLMRISSGTSGVAVNFDIGPGILERIAGRRAVFDIVARSGEGADTQISVSCNMGALGDCGANRFVVRPDRTELLFEIDVPEGAPSSGGTIAIVSDVSNKGHPLELYEIRVTIPE